MLPLIRGRYQARIADSDADIGAAQSLRALAFESNDGTDGDDFDGRCRHVLIEERESGMLVCCFRLLTFESGAGIAESYASQYYDLNALEGYEGALLEMGRFCLHPEQHDPDILRIAWAVVTQIVDDEGITMMFGCSSFRGTGAEAYLDAFAMLKDRHLAPHRFLPRVKAPDVFRFARLLRGRKPDLRRALAAMPPLLRSYLAMGGWVSDHAVVDRGLNTLHVFTGLEVGAVPARRAMLLRALAK